MHAMKSLLLFGYVVGLAIGLQRRPPNYSQDEMPRTSFSCRDKIVGGYYADPETDCQMFHVCVRVAGLGVQDFRFLCPNDTSFDQENQICDDWYNIDCEASTLYYSDNFDLYRIADGVPEFGPSRATPISLGPSSVAPHQYEKPQKRPHTPVNNAVSEDDDDSYLFKADTGDRRLHKDLLRGSSSGNFYTNKNQGKEDNEYEDVQDSTKNQLHGGDSKKKPSKGVVRKLLTGKRPVSSTTPSTTTLAASTPNAFASRTKYNTVQRNRPTTQAASSQPPFNANNNFYQTTATPYNANNNYQTASTATPQNPSTNFNYNYNFKQRGNVNFNANKQETSTIDYYNNHQSQSTNTQNYNNNNNNYQYNNNNYNGNRNQQPSTANWQNSNNYQTSTAAQQTSKQQSYQPFTTNYQQPTTAKPNYSNAQNFQQPSSTTFNYNQYYQTSTSTARPSPNFPNHFTTQATPFFGDQQTGTSSTASNSNYQTKNLYNFNVNAANTATAALAKSQQNYDPYNSYINNNNNDKYDEPSYGESLKTAPSSNIKPSDLNALQRQSYQQQKSNKPSAGFNATVSASYNFNAEAARAQNTPKPQVYYTVAVPTSKAVTERVNAPNNFNNYDGRFHNGFNTTTLRSAGNSHNDQNQYTTTKTYSTQPPAYDNRFEKTFQRPQQIQQQPSQATQQPQQSTTGRPKSGEEKKEKDASYDYAYYDDGSPSEYDGFDTVGEEFARTSSRKSKRSIQH